MQQTSSEKHMSDQEVLNLAQQVDNNDMKLTWNPVYDSLTDTVKKFDQEGYFKLLISNKIGDVASELRSLGDEMAIIRFRTEFEEFCAEALRNRGYTCGK